MPYRMFRPRRALWLALLILPLLAACAGLPTRLGVASSFAVAVDGGTRLQRVAATSMQGLPESGAKYNFPVYKPFVPDRWLENGETVSLGNLTFDVVHCPGHTPGHVVFVHKPSKVAFVGDVLFRGSVGRCDLPRGNHDQLVQSIRGGLWPLGDDIQFVPGHGQTSTFGWERKTNPYVADLLFDD